MSRYYIPALGNLYASLDRYMLPMLRIALGLILIPHGCQKLFAECVRLCLDPLPGTYAQKIFVENGGSWFGKTKSDCLGCHAEGKPKRFWPGINTLPEKLRRDAVSH